MTGKPPINRKTNQNITTVSLLETWEIKEVMKAEGGNFSRFVRHCLREWQRYEVDIVCMKDKHPDRTILCFPRLNRLCRKCWPSGPPYPHDWSQYMGHDAGYNQKPELGLHYHDDEWILARAHQHNAADDQDGFSVKDLPWRGRPPKVKVKVDPDRQTRRHRFRLAFWKAYRIFKKTGELPARKTPK